MFHVKQILPTETQLQTDFALITRIICPSYLYTAQLIHVSRGTKEPKDSNVARATFHVEHFSLFLAERSFLSGIPIFVCLIHTTAPEPIFVLLTARYSRPSGIANFIPSHTAEFYYLNSVVLFVPFFFCFKINTLLFVVIVCLTFTLQRYVDFFNSPNVLIKKCIYLTFFYISIQKFTIEQKQLFSIYTLLYIITQCILYN